MIKSYFLTVFILGFICLLSLFLTLGYDEGTLRNQFIGAISVAGFKFFKWPAVYLLPARYLIAGLTLNVFFLSFVVCVLFKIIKITITI